MLARPSDEVIIQAENVHKTCKMKTLSDRLLITAVIWAGIFWFLSIADRASLPFQICWELKVCLLSEVSDIFSLHGLLLRRLLLTREIPASVLSTLQVSP